MKRPPVIVLETSSMCNRFCPTCIRNSYLDREAVKSRFELKFMSMEMIEEFVKQYIELDFNSRVCLSHYNEPLMDPRIVDIIKLLKENGIKTIYLVTNGDFLTDEMAGRLDKILNKIIISLYDRRPYNKKNAVRFLFKKTKVQIKGWHIKTHFHPEAISLNDLKCKQPLVKRLIINYEGRYCLCCEDLNGISGFGSFPEIDLRQYWFGKKHIKFVKDLSMPGGRNKYDYCSICPR